MTYEDCKKCKFTFGENTECLDCSYYQDCMVEQEILEFELAHDRALDKLLSRLEDGEN